MLRKHFWLLPYLFLSATLFLVGFSNGNVVIDAGHGGSDSGAVSDGYIEKEWNLDTARACANELVKYGVYVYETRTDDVYISLEDRAKLANDNNVDYFISIHHNSSNGGADRGEVIYSIKDTKSQELALNIENELKDIGQTNVRTYVKSMGTVDYYSVLRNTEMSAIIIEVCFIDNQEDRKIADTKEERERNGIAIAHGILKQLGIDINNIEQTEVSTTDGTNIVNEPSATYDQLYQWAINNNASQTFLDNLQYIWDTSVKNSIDPILVATQCALETDYMRSLIFQTYNNTSGIKETSTTYRNYNTIEDGIDAQIEHLMLYAGVGYNTDSWLYGWCPTVEGLSGRWAEDTQYSDKILSMMNDVKNITVENDAEQIMEDEENIVEDNIENDIEEVKESNIFYDALNRNKDDINNIIQKIKEKFNL